MQQFYKDNGMKTDKEIILSSAKNTIIWLFIGVIAAAILAYINHQVGSFSGQTLALIFGGLFLISLPWILFEFK